MAALLETDPIDILLDEDGDLVLDGDGLHFVSGLAAVVQGIRFRLGLFRGEWFLNLDVGVPWYDEVLGEHFDEAHVRQLVADAINDTPGVKEITELTVKFDNKTRLITVTWAATTLFGDTPSDTLKVPV